MQIQSLEALKEMALMHGEEFDLSRPARNTKEAIQWTYFGYLAAVKEQDGAAMSLGRLDSFFDAYIEQDLADGTLTESEVQELIDDFVMKLRLVRHLRTPEYNQLFAGDPTWVTLVLGGMGSDGKPLVTKTSFRFLQVRSRACGFVCTASSVSVRVVTGHAVSCGCVGGVGVWLASDSSQPWSCA